MNMTNTTPDSSTGLEHQPSKLGVAGSTPARETNKLRVFFAHRPELGITVGVAMENGHLYISAAFANGVARGILMETYKRKRGNEIAAGRIQAAIKGRPDVSKIHVTPVGSVSLSLGDFMHKFRELFHTPATECISEEVEEAWQWIIDTANHALGQVEKELAK